MLGTYAQLAGGFLSCTIFWVFSVFASGKFFFFFFFLFFFGDVRVFGFLDFRILRSVRLWNTFFIFYLNLCFFWLQCFSDFAALQDVGLSRENFHSLTHSNGIDYGFVFFFFFLFFYFFIFFF